MKAYEHKVQYYETDQMKIVHHSNYIRWFEEARLYVLENIGFGYDQMEKLGIISPVLSVQAEYQSMTHFSDTVLIETKVSYYNGIKLFLNYTIIDKTTHEVRCIGESRHCFLNENGRVISLKRSFPQIHQLLESLKENNQ